MSRGPLVVIGDVLLDVDMHGVSTRLCPEATPESPAPVIECTQPQDRPGGAGLASLLAASLRGRDVVLVTGIGNDQAGRRICELLGGVLEVIKLPLRGGTPQKVRVRAGSDLLLRVDIGAGRAAAPGAAAERRALTAIRSASAVLVSDYGRGVAAQPAITRMLGGLSSDVPVVWDPHPKGGAPLPGTCLATPNEAEATAFTPRVTVRKPGSLADAARRAGRLVRAWVAEGVAVTLGPRGAVLATKDLPPLIAPAPRVRARDTCGAGDSFAAAAAHAIADGASLADAVVAGVSTAARFVAAGAASGIGSRGTQVWPPPISGPPERPRDKAPGRRRHRQQESHAGTGRKSQ